MAHIFAAIDGGPRTDRDLTDGERGAYENIVLLCANCHTLVDKTPEAHPASLMAAWKRDHLDRIRRTFGLKIHESRAELRGDLDGLLRENRAVHEATGPDLDYRFNPEAAEAEVWKARVKSTIIPNSNKILLLVDANRHLLTEGEKDTVERFRFHVRGLVLRHLDGQELANTKFPQEMNKLAQ
ncbi:hypothetical protein [Mesorhizobium sp. M7A.F.Ce.TU.012.03.2.1]|uniref:hypothetical protein n=1 Tax=Mesorhizobium sp. M7A.F.Ce.TU.012.03.2.1 TaxID=2493681 RepID=UPI000FD83B8D|nr:hypothetical protein [Mesorhizobium sp. M7A.F.Ce.TU.012.03.2.1]AZV20999.1 hypothetical protein EJ079_19165 [Mesorhizobium sp. M7A.F.Ce.TU.012.03.2.1]